MADKATTTRTLKFVARYSNQDTRTFAVKNPVSYTASDAETVRTKLNTFAAVTTADNNSTVDNTVTCTEITTAYIDTVTTINMDLSSVFNRKSA